MKVAREAKLGFGIVLVLGLIIAIPVYLALGTTGFSQGYQTSRPSTVDVVQALRTKV
jgi:hypothetical protein